MANSRPGVYVTETALRSNAVIAPAGVATGAFFGTSSRGPVTPTLVDSWSTYKSLFGDLNQSYELGYAVYQYFTNGGRVAYVTRVTGASATSASTSAVNYTPSTGASARSLFTAKAKNPGAWGNSLTITLSSGAVTQSTTAFNTFNMSIKLGGTEVEYWSELSPSSSDSRYVIQLINDYSSYVTLSNMASVSINTGLTYSLTEVSLAQGSDGSTVIASDYVSSLANLDTIEGSLIINLVGQTSTTAVNKALDTARDRGNSFVVIDPDPTSTTATAINSSKGSYSSTNGLGYGAVYYPMVKIIDPSKSGPAAVRLSYPGGSIVGAYVRTDTERGVFKTPAGYNVDLRNVIGLDFPITDTLLASTYDSGVNMLKAVPGAGIVVMGGRTLQTTKPDKYISIRRSLNYVKQGLTEITRPAVFEPNGPLLWSKLESKITRFLTDFWGKGGLKGQSANQAFYVVCDETNNPSISIDAGEVHVEVGLSLLYPAEFIVINVSQWAGGSNTLESL